MLQCMTLPEEPPEPIATKVSTLHNTYLCLCSHHSGAPRTHIMTPELLGTLHARPGAGCHGHTSNGPSRVWASQSACNKDLLEHSSLCRLTSNAQVPSPFSACLLKPVGPQAFFRVSHITSVRPKVMPHACCCQHAHSLCCRPRHHFPRVQGT